jgi:hypothetical protein
MHDHIASRMKLLFCEVCEDVVCPRPGGLVRYCSCRRHAFWREGSVAKVFDTRSDGIPTEPMAFIIGLSWTLLKDRSEVTTKEMVDAFRSRAGKPANDTALTWKIGSLVVKYRPGITPFAVWATNLPPNLQTEPRRGRS